MHLSFYLWFSKCIYSVYLYIFVFPGHQIGILWKQIPWVYWSLLEFDIWTAIYMYFHSSQINSILAYFAPLLEGVLFVTRPLWFLLSFLLACHVHMFRFSSPHVLPRQPLLLLQWSLNPVCEFSSPSVVSIRCDMPCPSPFLLFYFLYDISNFCCQWFGVWFDLFLLCQS